MALALAFHFSIPVAGAHAGPDADAALGGAGFVARDRAPARAACREDLQAHAGTRSVREGLERGRVGRVACEIDLLCRDEVPQIGAHLRFVRALLPPPQRGLQIRAEVLDADHTPSPGGALHPQMYDERRIGVFRADANADPGDAAALLYTSEALVAAFKSRKRVEQRGPDALLHRNDQRGLQGRIRGLQRAGGGARLIHDGLGGAADIEVPLDCGAVPGACGVGKLPERVHRRAAPVLAQRDDRRAGNGEAAHGEQCQMEARHGLIAPETEYYGVPRARGGESCSPVLPSSPGSSYCSPRVAVPPRPPSCCGGIRTNSGGQSVVSGPACRSTAWSSSGLSMTGCGRARTSGIGAFPWTPGRSVARGRLQGLPADSTWSPPPTAAWCISRSPRQHETSSSTLPSPGCRALGFASVARGSTPTGSVRRIRMAPRRCGSAAGGHSIPSTASGARTRITPSPAPV